MLRIWLARPQYVYPNYTLPQRLGYIYEAAANGLLLVGREDGRINTWAVVIPISDGVHIDAFFGTRRGAMGMLRQLKEHFAHIYYRRRGGKAFKHKSIWHQASKI